MVLRVGFRRTGMCSGCLRLDCRRNWWGMDLRVGYEDEESTREAVMVAISSDHSVCGSGTRSEIGSITSVYDTPIGSRRHTWTAFSSRATFFTISALAALSGFEFF